MSRIAGITTLALALVIAAAAPASSTTPQIDVTRCLQLTTTKGLATSRILEGLPLTPEQVSEVRSRLSQYNSVRGYPGIADLGLDPAVVAEINRRIQVQVAEWNKYPLGWPCMVFKVPKKTRAWVQQLLIDNGFRRVGLTIRKTSPRQFQFRGIQDGYEFFGVVAKPRKRQIILRLESPGARVYQTKRFTTPFEP